MGRAWLTALLPLALLAGCGGGSGGTRRAEIVRFPKWDFRPYERLALASIRTRDPRAISAATQSTRRLEQLLHENGAFTLVARDRLKDIFTEHDLAQLAGVADPATVIPPGRIEIAQALVIGEITVFDMRAERFEKLEPSIVTRSYTRRGYPYPSRRRTTAIEVQKVPRVYFRHSATVGGSIRVIDLATSRILLSVDIPPISREEEERDRPPELSPEECAAQAAEQLASAFYHAIAPIRVDVKLDEDSFGVALDYYDGAYDETASIPADAAELMLFVRDLPRECEQNPFRVTITRKDGREDLFNANFVWNPGAPKRGMQFRVPLERLDGQGDDFVAKLYSESGESPLLTRDFRIDRGE